MEAVCAQCDGYCNNKHLPFAWTRMHITCASVEASWKCSYASAGACPYKGHVNK